MQIFVCVSIIFIFCDCFVIYYWKIDTIIENSVLAVCFCALMFLVAYFFRYVMTKTFLLLIQYLQEIDTFWIWDLCHSYLFRISDFELRIFRKSNKQINSIHSACYLFKWLIPGGIYRETSKSDWIRSRKSPLAQTWLWYIVSEADRA